MAHPSVVINNVTYSDVPSIEITLTQQETLSLGVGNAEVQVRAIHDGTAIATDIQTVDVGRIIKEGVIDE